MFDCIEDAIIRWNPYTKKEKICARFSSEEWHCIASDIHSDEEWGDFLMEYPDFVRCYVLKRKKDGHPIGFVYIMREYDDKNVLSIHGGGWENPLMHYRGYILMLKYLLEQGFKVRTYCQLSNSAAIRFDRSVGFIPYRYTEEKVYMWLSKYSLQRSKVYRHFYSK